MNKTNERVRLYAALADSPGHLQPSWIWFFISFRFVSQLPLLPPAASPPAGLCRSCNYYCAAFTISPAKRGERQKGEGRGGGKEKKEKKERERKKKASAW